ISAPALVRSNLISLRNAQSSFHQANALWPQALPNTRNANMSEKRTRVTVAVLQEKACAGRPDRPARTRQAMRRRGIISIGYDNVVARSKTEPWDQGVGGVCGLGDGVGAPGAGAAFGAEVVLGAGGASGDGGNFWSLARPL